VYESILTSTIPILMVLVYIILICVSVLVVVKPPTDSEEKRSPARLYPRWSHLEREPEGTGKSLAAGLKPKIKAA
jgi:hypothetical protein